MFKNQTNKKYLLVNLGVGASPFEKKKKILIKIWNIFLIRLILKINWRLSFKKKKTMEPHYISLSGFHF